MHIKKLKAYNLQHQLRNDKTDYLLSKCFTCQRDSDLESGIVSLFTVWNAQRHVVWWKLFDRLLAPLVVFNKQIGDLHDVNAISQFLVAMQLQKHEEAECGVIRGWAQIGLYPLEGREGTLADSVDSWHDKHYSSLEGCKSLSVEIYEHFRVTEKSSADPAMSNLEVSYPIGCNISGSWNSLGSSLYCCKSAALYIANTFASSLSWSSPASGVPPSEEVPVYFGRVFQVCHVLSATWML